MHSDNLVIQRFYMRIAIDFSANKARIPYSHQHLLTGVIHKWLGENTLHGKLSLYSFSRLEGVKSTKEGLVFGDNGRFYFSAHDPEVVNTLIRGIFRDKTMFSGMSVDEIQVVENPDFTDVTQMHFAIGSPILIKRTIDNASKHFVYTDQQTDMLLKETLLLKMEMAGLEDESLTICFDRNYPKASTKLVDYDGIKNRANWCPVIVTGKPDTLLFAWNVGLGSSTGIGFGALK